MSAMSGLHRDEVDDDGLAVLRRAGAVLDRIARSSLSPLAPPRGNGYGARSWPPATTTPSPRVPSPTPVQPTRSTTTPLPPTVSSPPRESETMAAMRIERDQALQLAINAEAAEIEALERCAAATIEARFERRAILQEAAAERSELEAQLGAHEFSLRDAERRAERALAQRPPQRHDALDAALRHSHALALALVTEREGEARALHLAASVGGCVESLCAEVELRTLRRELKHVSASAERRAASGARLTVASASAAAAERTAARMEALAREQMAAVTRQAAERRRGAKLTRQAADSACEAKLKQQGDALRSEHTLALEAQARVLRAEYEDRRAADLERQSAVIAELMSCHMQQLATMQWDGAG